MDDSSNRSHLGAKSSHFQAKIRSHTRLYFTVALIKNTECMLLHMLKCGVNDGGISHRSMAAESSPYGRHNGPRHHGCQQDLPPTQWHPPSSDAQNSLQLNDALLRMRGQESSNSMTPLLALIQVPLLCGLSCMGLNISAPISLYKLK